MLSKETYDDRRERYISRVKSVLDYAREENLCRCQMLLSYFGEKDTKACGYCDSCLKRKENEVTTKDFADIQLFIQQVLSVESLTINALVKKIPYKEPKVLQVVRFMIDNGLIVENELMKLQTIQKGNSLH